MAKDGKSRVELSTVIALLGASAGLTFALYLVGVMIVTRRFGTLRLPGAETIVPVAREPLLAAGGRALVAPLLGAAASLILFALLVRISRPRPRYELLFVTGTLGAVAVATVALHELRDWGTWENAGFVGAVELAAAAAWAVNRWIGGSALVIAVLMALGIAAFASAFVLSHVWLPPVDLEYAEVELRNGDTQSGIYLALTANELYVAPAGKCKNGYVTHRRVVVLPRSDVRRITLHRKAHVWDGGHQQPGARAEAGCPNG